MITNPGTMQNFNPQAKDLVRDICKIPVSEATALIEAALNGAYNLGKKHLHEPHHLMGNHDIVPEIDTFNPIQ